MDEAAQIAHIVNAPLTSRYGLVGVISARFIISFHQVKFGAADELVLIGFVFLELSQCPFNTEYVVSDHFHDRELWR